MISKHDDLFKATRCSKKKNRFKKPSSELYQKSSLLGFFLFLSGDFYFVNASGNKSSSTSIVKRRPLPE